MNHKIKGMKPLIKKIKSTLKGNKKLVFDFILEAGRSLSGDIALSHYSALNNARQLSECDSDISSLIINLPLITPLSSKDAKQLFSAWLSYHEAVAHKYLPIEEITSEEHSMDNIKAPANY